MSNLAMNQWVVRDIICSMVKYPILVIDQVILIENKEESLVRARHRSAQLGLTNIGFIQTNLDYFTGNFNVGVRTV